MDLRWQWLVGVDPVRVRRGAMALGGLVVLLAVVVAAVPARSPELDLALVALPALGAVLYAAWNGGPLLALLATQAPVALGLLAPTPALDGAFALVALPAGLAAFGLGARQSHRALGGPPPTGASRAGNTLLAGWAVTVVVLAFLLTMPEEDLGPRIWGEPEWVEPVRSLFVWGPIGVALGWAMVRRGPVLVFAAATTHLWARYAAEWLVVGPRTAEALYLGELVLPPPLDPLRGLAMVGLGVAAMGVAMALEPAWPWMSYRQDQEEPAFVQTDAEPGQHL